MYIVNEQDFLSHHGIIGMHWGKRHGPMYPLGSSESAAIKERGREETASEQADEIIKLYGAPIWSYDSQK